MIVHLTKVSLALTFLLSGYLYAKLGTGYKINFKRFLLIILNVFIFVFLLFY